MRRSYKMLIVLSALLVWGCGSLDRGPTPNSSSSNEYLLVPKSDKTLTGYPDEPVDINVYLYDSESGDKLQGEPVSFRVVTTSVGEETRLSANQTYTNQKGLASVKARLSSIRSHAKVKVSHPRAKTIEFTVKGGTSGTGTLELDFKHPGQSILALDEVTARVYRDEGKRCDKMRPFEKPARAIRKKTTGQVSNTIKFRSINTRQEYLIFVRATGVNGQIAATGCLQKLRLEKHERVRKTIELQLVDLDPTGTYRITSHWDFTRAIRKSGTAGQIIMRALDLFENPGRALYREIIRAIRTYVNGLLATGVDQFLKTTRLNHRFIDAINKTVRENDTLEKIKDAGSEIRDIVANLKINGVLQIGRTSGSNLFRGETNWTGITLHWEWLCGEDAPPGCGKLHLEADPTGEIAELGVLKSSWNGKVVSYNGLEIREHKLNLKYGKIISYVISDVVIPNLTNGKAHTLNKAFELWLCGPLTKKVMDGKSEKCAMDTCVSDDKIDSICRDAVSTVFGAADAALSRLRLDLHLAVEGEARLKETNSDGNIDAIDRGTMQGVLQNKYEYVSSKVTADWSAERISTDRKASKY